MSIWLVARVLVGQEERVIHRLDRLGTEGYAPRYRDQIVDRRTHRRRQVIRRLFPCYLFVRTDAFYWLSDIEGITSIVMDGLEPARSSQLDRFVDNAKASEVDGFVPAPVAVVNSKFKNKVRVAILRGLFKGCCGVTLKSYADMHVDILMDRDLLGRKVAVRYSEHDLAAVEA
jgi:transcription antitermination factor NusG